MSLRAKRSNPLRSATTCFCSNLAPLAGRGRRALRASGEGVQVSRHLRLAEAAPHPDPLPVKNGEREKHTYAGTTSSLITKNFTRSIRPKLVVSATSAASRPVPIRMRPARGTLWRAANVDPPPGGKKREQPGENIRPGGGGGAESPP